MTFDQREELKYMLKKNRTSNSNGKSDIYWDSVVDTVDRFLDRHFKDPTES